MVTMTTRAAGKLKEIMEAENRHEQGVRIMVKPGGCSGFSYAMGFDSQVRDEDIVVEQHGIRVMIDPQSARFLQGIEVDYVESLMGGGFAIKNPNAVRTCGCGQSFRTRDQEGEPQECM
ncbi:MAG: iron-sulfur cluster insertion protein ErpA [Firmicutes bacterium]|nr:iron-sulfur cluster insertion protein ErpA [Bacillota bacterium]